MTEDTQVLCHECGAVVVRGHAFCSNCGTRLSASQLRVSALKRMTPKEFGELVQAHLARLAARPIVTGEGLRLDGEAKRLLAMLRLADPEASVERTLLDLVVAWCAAATTELRK